MHRTIRNEMRRAPDDIAKRDQQLHQQCHWIGFRVGVNRTNDVTDESVKDHRSRRIGPLRDGG